MDKQLKITIKNWEKYNPKRNQSTYTWLRLQNDFLTDPDLFCLNHVQKLVWLGILCEASKKNNGTVTINPEWMAYSLKCKLKEVIEAIDLTAQLGFTTLHNFEKLCAVAKTTPTNERTDVRTDELLVKQDLTESLFFSDYEAIYQDYPRKVKKQAFIEKLKKKFKTKKSLKELHTAVLNYAMHIKNEGTETKFIPHPTTFLNSWTDWLDPDKQETTEQDERKQALDEWDKYAIEC